MNGNRANVPSLSPLQLSAFGDAIEVTRLSQDKKMERSGALREPNKALPNGAVNGERGEDGEVEEEDEVCQESLVA